MRSLLTLSGYLGILVLAMTVMIYILAGLAWLNTVSPLAAGLAIIAVVILGCWLFAKAANYPYH